MNLLNVKKSSNSCSQYPWAGQDSQSHLSFPLGIWSSESLFTAFLFVQCSDSASQLLRVQMKTDKTWTVGAKMR